MPAERRRRRPMVDARRMEVYTRLFDAQGRPLTEVAAEVIDAGSFAEWQQTTWYAATKK